MEQSVQEVARSTGTTSRTLRHYDDIGLLPPTRIGSNGYRYYDQVALVRLQRILLLRELGLGLPVIAEVLDSQTDAVRALRTHIDWLRKEQDRIDRQIESIRQTLEAIEHERGIPMDTMFDGFDHTEHREEVERRWGTEAYASSAAWWEARTPEERAAFQREVAALNADWVTAAEADTDPASETAQALAERHVAWLTAMPGTPATNADNRKAYILGLAAMYVADPRFAANYGGEAGAAFVRTALEHYAAARL